MGLLVILAAIAVAGIVAARFAVRYLETPPPLGWQKPPPKRAVFVDSSTPLMMVNLATSDSGGTCSVDPGQSATHSHDC